MLLPCYSQRLFADSPSQCSLYHLYLNRNSSLPLSIALHHHLSGSVHFRILKLTSLRPDKFNSLRIHTDPFHLRAYDSEASIQKDVVGDFRLDSFLSLAEFSCLLSSAVLSIGLAVHSVIAASKKEFLVAIGNRVATFWGILMLVAGVLIGAWIRRRQWRRVCRETVKGGLEVNFLERIEKLEEDLRSSATVMRVLSRQLEKLGTRFRVTRKALKEPTTEDDFGGKGRILDRQSATLAKKNAEATRALAMQSDVLEKELGEIQKVLLAMQEHQQKQLDLILAIGSNGKLWESRQEISEDQDTLETVNSAEDGVKQKEIHQI
ncbi:hypothetical protein L6164_025167 [Bauhinia variegata]|uniref:Uncharacterized protein n=1 Tax=Bauhinia variegata TaxID=167791 RepID=A0ACB9M1C7_BAUVA|nr:hypothetical protein L6164_025167 [Bauhinia variegata]